jgi:hypothetical protein
MNPSDEFRRFAGECRAMARLTRSAESKATWDRLAVRWVRLAELNELHSQAATFARLRNRHSVNRRSSTVPALGANTK